MAEPEKILIVDDEKEIADLVALYLKNEGYDTFTFYDSADALKCIEEEKLDLAILDVMMPGTDGFALCTKIREEQTFPVIMLTAKIDEVSKITGLTLGADDYVTKPFLPLELVARVKAQLRRAKKYSGATKPDDDCIIIGGLSVNEKTHTCLLDGAPLNLTPTEFEIVRILAERKGQVLSSDALSREIWKDEYFDKGSTTITVHIRHIREKMGESFENPKYIKTIWGVGYKIDGA